MTRHLNIFALILAATVYGQSPATNFIKRPAFETGVIFQRWTANANRMLDEIVVPLVLHYPVSERFSVSVMNTPTYARLHNADTSFSLTGFTDTKISTALILGEERALLNFGVSAPSGPTALNAGETLVAQQITSHALAMPTSYFGGGVDVSASLAAALEVGGWILGGAAGGVYHGRYTPIAGLGKYLPGPEVSLALGFDRPLGELSRIFGDVGYTWYGKDNFGGQKDSLAEGKIFFSLAGILASEKWRAAFLLENRLKRKRPFVLSSGLPVGYGNEFDFSTEIARQMNRDAALLASAILRIYGKNDNGVGEAAVIGIGPGWRGLIAPPLQIEAVAHFAIGKIDGNQILGGDVKVGFVYQF
jgi:hypothetical protein